MENSTKLLEEKIQDSINEFTSRRRRMFNVVRRFKYPLVFLTAISTIVLGLELGSAWVVIQKNIALIIGALITGLTTLMTFWNVEEYWIKTKVIELQLISLQNKFQFEKSLGLTESRAKEFFSQYLTILGQQEELWKTTLDEKNDPPP
ncbi:MAG: SLATT domain-containing protein [Chitinophagales bacterium]|nr:SLATT domain-containing protein [Chitinophagales bacterium]